MSRKNKPRRKNAMPKWSALRKQAERDLARNAAMIEDTPKGTPRQGGRYG